MDRFVEVLKELGQIVNVPFHPDKHHVCELNINNVLHIQLEPDLSGERLLIASFLVDVPAGRFREGVFREALKANHPFERTGTLAYSARNNKLFFFHYLPFYQLTGEKLADFLGPFISEAESWRTSIESGSMGPSPSSPQKMQANPFGMRP
jgi:Tir chaperone family protein CesT